MTLTASLGRQTHAWFLSEVQRLDPALSEQLHAENQDRPFAVSNLWGDARRRGRTHTVEPGETYSLRVTSIDNQLSDLLLDKWLPDPPNTVRLGDGVFAVERATTDAKQHAWANTVEHAQLVMDTTLSEPVRSLELEFVSPTVFRSRGVHLPMPLPRLVFEGLARRWNRFSPIAIHEDVVRYADECMAISRYRLRTERVVFEDGEAKRGLPGFLGRCMFALTVHDPYWMGLIHLLAEFAFYAGVGRNTAMGMGQVRRRR